MAKAVNSQNRFYGIADYPKKIPQASLSAQAFTVLADTVAMSRAVDFRTDPQAVTLLPGAVKESGSVVVDLLKWADIGPSDLAVYSYGDTGWIYKRTAAGSWSALHQAPSSHGNGLAYFYGDDYLYYATDVTLGRYGPLAGTPQFSDDFLGAQGGTPLNTYSLSLASASSQYATASSSSSLALTSNITLETFFKANSLPAVGASMTLMGKWDESVGRSYKMDLFGVSNYFGDGSNGSLTISADTTDSPIAASCSGTAGAFTLSATNASFASGQVVLIIQMQDASMAGQWERNTIQGYSSGTITLGTALKASYTTSGSSTAQVMVLKQYTSVTINSGKTWTASSWDGSKGGILGFLANGTFTNNGTVSGTACGFRRQQNPNTQFAPGVQGEGTLGVGSASTAANGNGGGGGNASQTPGSSTTGKNGAGGGGGNGTAGLTGPNDEYIVGGTGGSVSGSADLTTFTLGGAGGNGGNNAQWNHNQGGTGGGGLMMFAAAWTNAATGTIVTNGNPGETGTTSNLSGHGGGAGGSVLIKTQVYINSGALQATGGAGGAGIDYNPAGAAGGSGRLHLDYLTSMTDTGTSTPTITTTQDNTLTSSASTQARLSLSSTGSNSETLAQTIQNLTTGVWNRLSISWNSSTKVAKFYLNGNLFGQSTGALGAINSNASAFSVGANKVAAYQNFFNGLLDDMRVWNIVATDAQIANYNQAQLSGTEGGLQSYWTFNNIYTDTTANGNTLTGVNSPTFSTDVPFPATSTRLDIDQSDTSTYANTYTLTTTVSEAAADTFTFTPTLDPQKAIDFKLVAKGTGNWTVTIHDQQNKVIATQTITNALLPSSGYVVFTYTTAWRLVIGKTYHAHLTSTVADGTVQTSASSSLVTPNYHTYFQFLVSDTQFHPITRMLNKIVIGNERYLATWDGAFYQGNFIAFPPQTHVRCFGFWREYLAIGTWQEKTTGTPGISDWSQGRVYFWDGISQTFNFWIDVPEGQVNALFGSNTSLYIVAGYNAQLLLYQGVWAEVGVSSSQKLKRLPQINRGDVVEIYPGALTMWRSLLHVGAAVNSTSSTLQKGVYSWGTLNQLYPECLSLDYPISTGNYGSSVSVGLVFPAGKQLLIGWRDGIGYGADVIDFANDPAPSGTIELLIEDNEAIWHEKEPLTARADYLPLASGESVLVKYKVDRAAAWTPETVAESTVGDTFAKLYLSQARGREYQLAVDLFATGSTSPTLLGLTCDEENLKEEQQL